MTETALKEQNKEIARRSKELMYGEYSPLIPGNIQEAMGNMEIEIASKISDRLKKNDLLPIGDLVKSEVNRYWKARADEVARASVLVDLTQRMLREIDDGRGNC